MYYVLDYERVADDDGKYLAVDDTVAAGIELGHWSLGLPLELVPTAPFLLTAQAIGGYQGPPADLYDFRVCLMSGRMIRVLRESGVDNLDVYPAFLVESQTGTKWPIFVVNIIGRVAAADLTQSAWTSPGETRMGELRFDKLTVDAKAAAGLLLFRTAENLRTILIHERVKNRLEVAGLHGVSFVDPSNWST